MGILYVRWAIRWQNGGRMKAKLWYRRILCIIAIIAALYTGYVIYSYINHAIPDKIHVVVHEQEEFNFHLPLSAEITCEDKQVSFSGKSNIPQSAITLDLRDSFTMQSSDMGTHVISMKLFGIFPIKDIEVSVIEETQVIPCGFPVGIYLETDGILVIGTARVVDDSGNIVEPAYALLKSGDYIEEVNGIAITSKNDLIHTVASSNGEDILLTVRRNGERMRVAVSPVKTGEGDYKLGIWVRDDAQGIGTLTFVTTDGKFGGLGHGVSDVDTGVILDSSEGKLYEAKILSIIKGEAGSPGGLSGIINYQEGAVLGKIEENTAQGIFGTADTDLLSMAGYECMDIGLRQEVKMGPAYVRCKVDGTMKDYEIRIVKIDHSPDNLNKGMEIRIVDEELLAKTNGIVQGMSGSPIIQDGKLIGAVTHVFVQDSTRGYGIFIENMLSH